MSQKRAFILFLFVAVISFALFLLVQSSLAVMQDPLYAVLTFAIIGSAMYVVMQLLINGKLSGNTHAKLKPLYGFILIVAVAGAMFIGYAAYTGGYLNGIINFNGQGAGTMLTVTYVDGTTKVFNSADFNPLGLAITDPYNKAIASVRIELYITPTWTASSALSSYAITGGTTQMNLMTVAGSSLYTSGQVPISLITPAPQLVSGQSVVITSATLTADQIQALATMQSGYSYKLVYTMQQPLMVTLHFADGSEASKTATAPQLQWVFKYANSSFDSLTVTFQTTTT